jgi:aminoglycoside 3-N-acetyltransferase
VSEKQAVASRETPNTIATLTTELKQLGLKPGMVVLVHSSLSALGWVSGGAVAVVQALMQVVTETGTIVMPTHSRELSDPRYWENPPVPKSWWQTIRDTMPAFDPAYTPTRGMGKIVECFRTFPGVKRSYHPDVSLAAWGKHATEITKNHSLSYGCGENSPLQKIYDLNGHVLLLGVGHGNNTSLHLSEVKANVYPICIAHAPIINAQGQREWRAFEDVDAGDGSDLFEALGQDFESAATVLTGKIGNATAKLMNQKDLVDFGVNWLQRKMGSSCTKQK